MYTYIMLYPKLLVIHKPSGAFFYIIPRSLHFSNVSSASLNSSAFLSWGRDTANPRTVLRFGISEGLTKPES